MFTGRPKGRYFEIQLKRISGVHPEFFDGKGGKGRVLIFSMSQSIIEI